MLPLYAADEASADAAPRSVRSLEPMPRWPRCCVHFSSRHGWLLPLTFAFSGGRIHFFMLRDHPGTALFWLSAAFLWWQHVRLTRELTTAGL